MADLLTRVRNTVSHRIGEARTSKTARRVRDENLTYLMAEQLQGIEACLRDVLRRDVEGDFLEAGLALGGSGIVIAGHLRDGRAFHGFDVFGMIPPPTENDPPEVHERYATIRSGASEGIGGDTYYGYRDDLYEQVRASFERFGVPVDGQRVVLHRGLFEDTLRPDRPVAFAHLDCDWYDPVALCLQRIHPHLSPGGYVVIDDYYAYGGARRATDEFLAETGDLERSEISSGRHLVLRRR
jgi:asparagine synthase (glutamine-hydrolysing)